MPRSFTVAAAEVVPAYCSRREFYGAARMPTRSARLAVLRSCGWSTPPGRLYVLRLA